MGSHSYMYVSLYYSLYMTCLGQQVPFLRHVHNRKYHVWDMLVMAESL